VRCELALHCKDVAGGGHDDLTPVSSSSTSTSCSMLLSEAVTRRHLLHTHNATAPVVFVPYPASVSLLYQRTLSDAGLWMCRSWAASGQLPAQSSCTQQT
jgi:hypothetical protein